MLSSVLLLNIPDNWLPWVVLVILVLLVIVVGPKASASDVKLNPNSGYKYPMLAFELNAAAAPTMFKDWEQSKSKLKTALQWDFLFIFIYSASIATACFIAARFLDSKKGWAVPFKYSLIVICLQLVAAMFDASENVSLLKVLQGPIESPWPQLARWCAICKFSLIIVGLVYSLIFGIGAWLFSLFTKSPQAQ
jgi:hypothetical protein